MRDEAKCCRYVLRTYNMCECVCVHTSTNYGEGRRRTARGCWRRLFSTHMGLLLLLLLLASRSVLSSDCSRGGCGRRGIAGWMSGNGERKSLKSAARTNYTRSSVSPPSLPSRCPTDRSSSVRSFVASSLAVLNSKTVFAVVPVATVLDLSTARCGPLSPERESEAVPVF